MTINERIKHLRKDILGIKSQRDFGDKMGMKQTTVSAFEREGSVNDITIRSICMAYNVNEEWLRYGTGNVFASDQTFSLDEFLQERGASQLEIDFLKAYFDLDEQTRRQLIENFKRRRAESSGWPSDDIEHRVSDYRKQLLDEKKAPGESSVSQTAPAADNFMAG
ncbi:MAG: helix-turn-helix transcriptional regulator [Eubacteriales bacterium]|nr:helix-turn-helix transcriptional regulator [Eubacteriales bacterium]